MFRKFNQTFSSTFSATNHLPPRNRQSTQRYALDMYVEVCIKQLPYYCLKKYLFFLNSCAQRKGEKRNFASLIFAFFVEQLKFAHGPSVSRCMTESCSKVSAEATVAPTHLPAYFYHPPSILLLLILFGLRRR
jgi:hypothetical protein